MRDRQVAASGLVDPELAFAMLFPLMSPRRALAPLYRIEYAEQTIYQKLWEDDA